MRKVMKIGMIENSPFLMLKKVRLSKFHIKSGAPICSNFRNWSFQKKIPVIYSEYTTKMIPFFKYNYILQGILTLDEFKKYTDNGLSRTLGTTEYHDLVYDFIMKDVPSF